MISIKSLTLGWGPPHLISEDAVNIVQGTAYRAQATGFVLPLIFLLYSSKVHLEVVLAVRRGPRAQLGTGGGGGGVVAAEALWGCN